MDDIRREFIKEVLETLKIPSGAFNIGTVASEIEHIPNTKLRDFHKSLFGTQHSYLNGMDRIIKVAEQFKPQANDTLKEEAENMMSLVRCIRDTIFDNAKTSGRTFDDELKGTSFPSLSEKERFVLSNIKQLPGLKNLISNFNNGWNGVDQLNAFKQAILSYENKSDQVVIAGSVKKIIGS